MSWAWMGTEPGALRGSPFSPGRPRHELKEGWAGCLWPRSHGPSLCPRVWGCGLTADPCCRGHSRAGSTAWASPGQDPKHSTPALLMAPEWFSKRTDRIESLQRWERGSQGPELFRTLPSPSCPHLPCLGVLNVQQEGLINTTGQALPVPLLTACDGPLSPKFYSEGFT